MDMPPLASSFFFSMAAALSTNPVTLKFQRKNLAYLGAWKEPLSFSFLPVTAATQQDSLPPRREAATRQVRTTRKSERRHHELFPKCSGSPSTGQQSGKQEYSTVRRAAVCGLSSKALGKTATGMKGIARAARGQQGTSLPRSFRQRRSSFHVSNTAKIRTDAILSFWSITDSQART